MTTEEKANEICKRHIFDSNHYDCCMEMAEWKERQMIEKAFEFIAEWFYEHPHSQMVCSDEFETVDKLLNRLKKAMEE